MHYAGSHLKIPPPPPEKIACKLTPRHHQGVILDCIFSGGAGGSLEATLYKHPPFKTNVPEVLHSRGFVF